MCANTRARVSVEHTERFPSGNEAPKQLIHNRDATTTAVHHHPVIPTPPSTSSTTKTTSQTLVADQLRGEREIGTERVRCKKTMK